MSMPLEEYRRALEAARVELAKSLEQRGELDSRITRLQQTVSGLSGLCDESVEQVVESPGLTDAVRLALKDSPNPLTAPMVKERIEKMGFCNSKYTNLLAVIHTILRRLVESGEVEVSAADGKKMYAQKRSAPPDYDLIIEEALAYGPKSLKEILAYSEERYSASDRKILGERLTKGLATKKNPNGKWGQRGDGSYELKVKPETQELTE